YGFENFDRATLFSAGDQKEDESSLEVAKGKEKEVEIALSDGFELVIKNDEEDLYEIEYEIDESLLNEDGELTAPIEKGQKVGQAKLVYSGEENYGNILAEEEDTVDLITTDAVEKDNWFMIALSSVGEFFSNLFSTVSDKIKSWF